MAIKSFVNSRQRQRDTGAFRKLRLQQPKIDRLREKAVTGRTPLARER